ncbi:MAG: hypothetical protein JSS17_02080 [Proteobacteria bacterium]|nr:hypothetical protein [Pseudomonadota bacterium]
MKNASIKTRPFDPAEHLRGEADVVAYLQTVLDDDPALLAAALDDIARARAVVPSMANPCGSLQPENLQAGQ